MVEALYYTLWATYLLVIVDKKKFPSMKQIVVIEIKLILCTQKVQLENNYINTLYYLR